jgi:hypothetical protein
MLRSRMCPLGQEETFGPDRSRTIHDTSFIDHLDTIYEANEQVQDTASRATHWTGLRLLHIRCPVCVGAVVPKGRLALRPKDRRVRRAKGAVPGTASTRNSPRQALLCVNHRNKKSLTDGGAVEHLWQDWTRACFKHAGHGADFAFGDRHHQTGEES